MPKDSRIQFGFEECSVLKMKRGKKFHCEDIDFGDGVVIEEANVEGYKYLEILKRDDVTQEKMKEKVEKE